MNTERIRDEIYFPRNNQKVIEQLSVLLIFPKYSTIHSFQIRYQLPFLQRGEGDMPTYFIYFVHFVF